MSNATATRPDAAIAGTVNPAAQPRGFPGLRCLQCGEEDTVTVRLHDATFVCSECEGELDLDGVEEALAAWQRVLAWVKLAPPLPE